MSRAQAESVIKNIIREIVQECAGRGQAISETLVAFIVKAVVLDPANEFSTDKTLTRDDVQKLIKLCVTRLMDTKSPALDTIKMQVFFDMNYTSRKEFMQEHKRIMDVRLHPIVREITDSRAKTKDELESLYRKIVSHVLLRSGLGSPTDINVVREATAALQSVFPQSELGTFLNMSKPEKERHLQELSSIVTGIRLFNKDCGKGGEGIDDLPTFLNEAIPATTQTLDEEIKRAQDICDIYTSVIAKWERHHSEDQHQTQSDGDMSSLAMPAIRQAAYNCRQHIIFLRIILADVIRSAEQVEQLMLNLQQCMEKLHATVQSKAAVPTAQVYPQFMHASDIWTGFQDEMVILTVLTNILNNLDGFASGHRTQLNVDQLKQEFLSPEETFNDEKWLELTDNYRIDPKEYPVYDWIFPETTKNFDRLQIQYRSYCAWSLAKCGGTLIPGNVQMGVLSLNNAYYAFSSAKAVHEFCQSPEKFIEEIANLARKNPELIQMLEMHQQFTSISPQSSVSRGGLISGAGKLIEKPITKADVECQTDTHILEPRIIKDYEWNEWELRRKAIKLANLRHKVTTSMQTDMSHWRRDNVSQVYLPKDQQTQSKRDNYSNVPKPSVFLHGLRGCGLFSRTLYSKIDLTLPIEQQLCGDTKERRF